MSFTNLVTNNIQGVMDWYSTISTRRSGLDFKLPVTLFWGWWQVCPASRERFALSNIFSFKMMFWLLLCYCRVLAPKENCFSCQTLILDYGVRSHCKWEYLMLLIFSLRVNHPGVLVNPPKFDASASDSVMTKPSFSNRSENCFIPKSNVSDFEGLRWHNTRANAKQTYKKHELYADWTSTNFIHSWVVFSQHLSPVTDRRGPRLTLTDF